MSGERIRWRERNRILLTKMIGENNNDNDNEDENETMTKTKTMIDYNENENEDCCYFLIVFIKPVIWRSIEIIFWFKES